jgi:hypothetical protein
MVCNDLVHKLRVTTRALGPVHALMNVYIIPRSIYFTALNGFPKLDLDIVVRLVKLYKMSSKATLVPLVMELSEGGWKQKCELVPILRFGTLISNVALLTRV